MKSHTIIALLCLACVANASLSDVISQVSSHISLRGKLGVRNDDGLRLSYNGTLGYDNGKVSVDIADVGAAFLAQSLNTTHPSNGFGRGVGYNGSFSVNQNGKVAGVEVVGLASVIGGANHTTEDNITDVNYTLKAQHLGGFNASLKDYVVSGGHWQTYKNKGNIQVNGTTIKAAQKHHAFATLASNTTHNDDVVYELSAANTLTANVDSETVLTGGQANAVSIQGKIVIPDATTNGKSDFSTASFVNYNGQNVSTSSEGQAGFHSVAWAKIKADENGTVAHAGVADNINFTSSGKVFVNGAEYAESVTVGDLGFIRIAESQVNNNGTWASSIGALGALNSSTLGHTVGNNADKFLAKYKAAWAHGVEAKGARIAENSTIIGFRAGTKYSVAESNNATNKTWEHDGEKNVSGLYGAGADPNQPGDLILFF